MQNRSAVGTTETPICAVPTGLVFKCNSDPALKRWAKLFRAYLHPTSRKKRREAGTPATALALCHVVNANVNLELVGHATTTPTGDCSISNVQSF
jgi:hypothetical protein